MDFDKTAADLVKILRVKIVFCLSFGQCNVSVSFGLSIKLENKSHRILEQRALFMSVQVHRKCHVVADI
jgi:hypothetical protein